MEIRRIGVLGAGTMGHGIAQVCAQSGYQVNLQDIKDEFVEAGISKIQKFLDGSVERKRMTQDEADLTSSRIKGTTDLREAAKDVDLVIEAIVEDINIKKDVFKELDQICPEDAIFASNTSAQSITEMAMVTKHPDRFIGMHWFNPPQLMRGIEVIVTDKTSQETLDTMVNLCKKLGKEPGICKDSPGFIVNRLLQIWYNESLNMFDEGVADPQDIDTALKVAYNFRMGPFELRDLVGLDVALVVSETHYRELMREQFKPPRCLVMKVKAGDLGRKTGRGFYEYESKT
ncbi:MAG TPA: 3-hydroxyacyl-CoA dehydrogenase family protein [Dehalococcoidia bacterium]|nr:3-hydroxyacyl-CoA dehydrogenase family protein [Dehalococcoidia bacterium]